jgi:RNA polymerase sigma-70 factor (ECF subfamily)
LLYQLQPNPVVAMNKAIASAYAVSADHALKELHAIKGLEHHHLYFASLGELYLDKAQPAKAREYFERAIGLTCSLAEQQLLAKKLSLCKN